jgi:hypothetical protein
VAAAQLALGRVPQALDELERAVAERDIRLEFLGIDARLNALRAQPRFLALLHALLHALRLPNGAAASRL